MTQVTISELLRSGAAELAPHSESARLDAELLLGEILSRGRAQLAAHGEDPVEPQSAQAFRTMLRRRREGMPVAYLTGRREFWSLGLRVTPQVLVPRPETETLVERALELLPRAHAARVLDLGTGSGAIALAIARERPLCAVVGTDLSPEALAVARENAAGLGIGNVAWRRGHWFDAVPSERFDAIVSNPPYVAADDPALAALQAEPREALTPGITGLEALEQIAAGARGHLLEGGFVALEHGADQAEAVAALLASHGFRLIRSLRDAAGRPRVALGFPETNFP